MIERNDLLAFDFYKKEKFSGSFRGMRYRIEKKTDGEVKSFLVTSWPGPYNYVSTEDALKTCREFPFEEGQLQDITNYLNQVYENGIENWPAKI